MSSLVCFELFVRPAIRKLMALEPGPQWIKATQEILKAFGQLKPLASLLVIAALLFVCATVLAWRGLGA